MKQENKELLSLIIPVYNEEKTIEKVISRIINIKLYIKKELIIIDDFSKDNSLKLIEKFCKNLENIKIIAHKKNSGKGSAIRTGLKYTKGTIIGIQDSDLEYDPKDYEKLIKPILEKETDVVYGSRFLKNYKFKKNRFYYGNKILSLITSVLYMTKITDMETCYKFFRKDILKNIKLKSRRFDIEPEITAKIIRRGYKIKEVPINYSPRSVKEGKKISFRDGLTAIYTLIRYRILD